MLKLTRWCIAHRRWVVVGWIAIAVGSTVIAGAVGRNYATNFTLPGNRDAARHSTCSRASSERRAATSTRSCSTPRRGTIDSPAVRAAIEPLLAQVRTMPHVVGVISPYHRAGAVQVSRDRRTAFATINYDKRANLLPNATGKPVLGAVKRRSTCPGLQVAAGGQVIEQAEGFNIGPATAVGVDRRAGDPADHVRLADRRRDAAGDRGPGLITGIALIGLATHVTDMSNVSPELALMIGSGVGIDYALFIVTRFRENYGRTGDVEASVSRRWTPPAARSCWPARP